MRSFYDVTVHYINQIGKIKAHLLAFNSLSGKTFYLNIKKKWTEKSSLKTYFYSTLLVHCFDKERRKDNKLTRCYVQSEEKKWSSQHVFTVSHSKKVKISQINSVGHYVLLNVFVDKKKWMSRMKFAFFQWKSVIWFSIWLWLDLGAFYVWLCIVFHK